MKTWQSKIRKHTIYYLSWFIVMVLFWIWVFGFLTRIPAEEKISVFIGTFSRKFDSYEDLNDKDYLPEYLKTVEVNLRQIEEDSFFAMLEVFGYKEADILILPESEIKACEHYYSSITKQVQKEFEQIGCDLGWYQEKDVTYGIRIYDSKTEEQLISCLDYKGDGSVKEDFYLLFNVNSLHLGTMSEENYEMDAAYVVAKRLLQL